MKRKRRIQWYYSVILLAFGLTACQVKRPDTVISDAKMENVLYDFHIAKAMGEEVPYSESYKRVLYIESVYRKHGITQADFDTSMVWYARHPDALTKVYEKVNQRLKAERDGINHLIALRDNKPKESSPGDSIDVWRGRHICYLTGTPMDNKLTFTLPSDTNFKDRDTLRWTVRFHFLNGTPDSLHAPLMAMQVLYAKDTLNDMLKVKQSGTETISLFADTLGEIKEIRGFIYYPAQQSTRDVLADRISLMRYHAKDTLFKAPADSLEAGDKELKKEPVPGKPAELKRQSEEKDTVRQRSERRPRPRLLQTTEKQ